MSIQTQTKSNKVNWKQGEKEKKTQENLVNL